MTVISRTAVGVALVLTLALSSNAEPILEGSVDIENEWETCFQTSRDITGEQDIVLSFQLYDANHDATSSDNRKPSGVVYIDGRKKMNFSGWSDPAHARIFVSGPIKRGRHSFTIRVDHPSELYNLEGSNGAGVCP